MTAQQSAGTDKRMQNIRNIIAESKSEEEENRISPIFFCGKTVFM